MRWALYNLEQSRTPGPDVGAHMGPGVSSAPEARATSLTPLGRAVSLPPSAALPGEETAESFEVGHSRDLTLRFQKIYGKSKLGVVANVCDPSTLSLKEFRASLKHMSLSQRKWGWPGGDPSTLISGCRTGGSL